MKLRTKDNDDREYVVTLLLGCIDVLSRDLSMHTNINPEYIVTGTMLKQALTIQCQGVDKISSLLESDHGWLIDHIENLV